MTKPAIALVGAVAALMISLPADAAPTLRGWPRLQGGETDPACQQALTLAREAFRSSAPGLLGDVTPAASFPSTIEFEATGDSATGDTGVEVDKAAFSVLSRSSEGDPARLYWQNSPSAGSRIAIVKAPFNWRGDVFYTFLLSEQIPAKAVWDTLASPDPDKAPLRPVTQDFTWTAPLVMHDRTRQADWIVVRGEPYAVLGAWRVLTPASGSAPLCEVTFAPPFKKPTALLPPEVRRFAALLDDALGPGHDEGTLHPTDAIRLGTSIQWGDAALRPWALGGDSYNGRAAVDAGLAAWAKASPKRAAVRAAIAAAWPSAERALQRFYTDNYGVRPDVALRMSRFALDAVYRSNFTFSRSAASGGADAPHGANPWPKAVR